MKKFLLVITIVALTFVYGKSQDTYSIVAVDSATGEVGGAGASCLPQFPPGYNVAIISDVHPGRGIIHTQAYYYSPNQSIARTQMNLGKSPEEILAWVILNDVNVFFGPLLTDSNYRQYGIADFDSSGSPRAAAYTGDSTDNYKGHRVGSYYSIQGNILLGPQILDSMEARFLNTEGDLACRLMAAIQGANVPGADQRCLGDSTSATTAYLVVAKPTDFGTFYIDLSNMSALPTGVEPVDSLQSLFDAVLNCDTTPDTSSINENFIPVQSMNIYPNPLHIKTTISITLSQPRSFDHIEFQFYDLMGKEIQTEHSIKLINNKEISIELLRGELTTGTYFFYVSSNAKLIQRGKLQIF
ncbi:MAG: DUF1028 domain-containing protein [Bacteroidetes bacterium]|nr:DUF1028 domain-containing protein [Bacteroidota bacterium]